MERVIVEVRLKGEPRGRDVELAAGLPIGQLAPQVAQALGWTSERAGGAGETPFDVEASPPGRVLRPDETLAQAQAWDGAVLVFSRSAPKAAAPAAGFAWKQVV